MHLSPASSCDYLSSTFHLYSYHHIFPWRYFFLFFDTKDFPFFSFDIKLPSFSSIIISPKTFILEVDNFLVESKFLELFLIHCFLGNHWYDILSIERGFQHSLRLGYNTYFKPQFQCPGQTFIKIHFVTRLHAIKWDVILW